jgi:hypothetical protein
MQVLYAYLNGEETLEAALTAWRTMPLIDSDEDEETVLTGEDYVAHRVGPDGTEDEGGGSQEPWKTIERGAPCPMQGRTEVLDGLPSAHGVH